jgi:hypothetical protein
MGHKVAQHQKEVPAAYEAYYGAMARPVNASTANAPRKSEESQRTLVSEEFEAQPEAEKQQQGKKSAWQRVKQHAKEHHESVNNAYRAYYGAS